MAKLPPLHPGEVLREQFLKPLEASEVRVTGLGQYPPIGCQQAGKPPRNCSLGMLAAPPLSSRSRRPMSASLSAPRDLTMPGRCTGGIGAFVTFLALA
jgi:hypothetical protein